MYLNKPIVAFVIFLFLCSCSKNKIQGDIHIKNGLVFNGVDTIASKVSIVIKEDKIIYVGNEKDAIIETDEIIDALGLIVSPGFIDPHTHADRDLTDSLRSHNKPFVFQGVTTVVTGNDGDSFYPTADYIKLLNSNGMGTNVVPLVGHATIREEIMGKSDRKANEEELTKMKNLVHQEMKAGVFGISTGLFYAPGSYSNTDEIIELAKTVSDNDGIYDTHLRDESSYTIGLISAVKEAIEVGRKATIDIHISHIKCLGVDVWKESDSIIKLIEHAQKEGIKITANQYPYDASATSLQAAVVPRWAESGGKDSLLIRYYSHKLKALILEETKQNIVRRGGPEKLLLVKTPDTSFLNKNLLEIAKMLNVSPSEAVFKVLEKGNVRVASFNMNPYDIENFMTKKWIVTGSDGNTGHPRKYGTFPRKYHTYVKQKGIINLATFINNSTSKTAEIFKIHNRGTIQEGKYADIIIFDPKTFKDKSDYTDAFQFAVGLEYSIINGKLSIKNGKFTNKLNGKVLSK